MPLTKIRLARMERDVKMYELAQMIGIPESHLSKIETGRSKPSVKILKKIAQTLNMPIMELSE